jgi:flagellar basal-body rod protein FlgF
MDHPGVVQGAVEGSNVSTVMEMVRMTEEVREFQNAVNFADREGERLQGAVERILRKRS